MITDADPLDPGPDGDGDGVDHGLDGTTWSSGESPAGTRVITARATLDAAAATELRRQARALLARSVHRLVVDLTAVRVAEPAAASAVLRDLAYEAGDADVDLRVVRDLAAPEAIRAILDGEPLFEVYPTVEAALRRRPDGAAPPP